MVPPVVRQKPPIVGASARKGNRTAPRVTIAGMLPGSVPSIAPAEVAGRVAQGWVLLDVRTPAEWADGRIEGSRHLPMDQVVARLDEVADRVVCVCAVGARSARVTAYLNAQGHEAVNLDGGLQAWVTEGHPLTA